jgi:hypothetical protein
MRKSDKKIENQLRITLTEICDFALDNITDYKWISHSVNYTAFPQSLIVTCAFGSQQSLENIKASKQDTLLKELIISKLNAVGIKINDMHKQIKFILG